MAARRPSSTKEPSARWAYLSVIVGLMVGLFCIGFEWATQAVRLVALKQVAGLPPGEAVGEANVLEDFFLEVDKPLAEQLYPATGEGSPSAGVTRPSAGEAPSSMGGGRPSMGGARPSPVPGPPVAVAVGPETASPSMLGLWCMITLGGLISGGLVYWLAPEAAGPGTDAAVDAFHNRKGAIGLRIAWVKTLASAILLGTGGSAGREGPIAQIGAAVGSWFGGRLNLTARDRRILLAAGMGAGVGAMFRAPLAGAIFAAEILYSDADMEADVVVPSAIASIVAYSVYILSLPPEVRFQPLFGGDLSHSLESPIELIPYTLLGLVMLVCAAGYVRVFQATQALFERLPVVPHLRPAIGAGLAGAVGITGYVWADRAGGVDSATPMLGVLGTGYRTLQAALVGDATATLNVLIGVGLLKIVTSSLSIGSGGAGGVFGPSMVIGGCLGAAFGELAHAIAPTLVPYPEAYAVVGMAGFFSGVARAPISTIIMIRELTGDFALIVPTMLVSALTFLISRRWTLYRKQVPTRLESPAHRGDFFVDVLEGLLVEDVYPRDRKLTMIPESATLDEIVHGLASSNQHYFPVVDAKGKMVGIFSDNDVRAYLFDSTLWRLANAGDVMTSRFICVSPKESLNSAMQKFTSQNVDELPVIDPDDPGTLMGFLRRKETIGAYNRRVMEHRKETD